MTLSSQTSQTISTVVIGYARQSGVTFMPLMFQNTPYNLTAFLDLVESRESTKYTKHNLEVVLDCLHPRPRILIIGAAIAPSMVTEMKPIWNKYVDDVLKPQYPNDSEKHCLVSMPDWCYIDPTAVNDSKPPANVGLQEETIRQLDAVFRPTAGSV